jgi:hypothetical protein
VFTALWEGAFKEPGSSEPEPRWSDMVMDGGVDSDDGLDSLCIDPALL